MNLYFRITETDYGVGTVPEVGLRHPVDKGQRSLQSQYKVFSQNWFSPALGMTFNSTLQEN